MHRKRKWIKYFFSTDDENNGDESKKSDKDDACFFEGDDANTYINLDLKNLDSKQFFV